MKLNRTKLLIYLVLVIAFYISLWYLNFQLADYGGGGDVRRIFDSMFLAIPILICGRKRLVYPYLLVLNLYFLSIIWYYRTYGTIMPLSSYLMLDNLSGLGPSISNSIHLGDVFLILPSLCFSGLYLWYMRKSKQILYPLSTVKWIVVVVFFIITTSVVFPYLPNERPSWKQPLYLFSTTQVHAFKKYGIVHYWIYQIVSAQSVSKESKNYAQTYMNHIMKGRKFNSTNSLIDTHKNLIIILVESLQSWPIGLKNGNLESTPNLNKMLNQKDVVYFPKVMSQVKDGRSSDAQLLINTGLLPLSTGAASSLCATNTFPSLAKALKSKEYQSVSFLCDDKTYWNQSATSIAYGFDQLYDNLQGAKERKEADGNLFKESLRLLKEMKQPFYAQVVTFSSHEPYVEPILTDSPLLNGTFSNNEVRNYLIALQYVDKCIGEFLENLKSEGLYDNSVIVITGDHEQMTFNNYEGRRLLLAEDCFVPFIILNSPLSSKHTDKVIGQMDLYPSLLDLMDCSDYAFAGLGESVFCDKISDYATYRTGISAGGTNVPDSVKRYREECWKVSDILLRMNYFKDKLY